MTPDGIKMEQNEKYPEICKLHDICAFNNLFCVYCLIYLDLSLAAVLKNDFNFDCSLPVSEEVADIIYLVK